MYHLTIAPDCITGPSHLAVAPDRHACLFHPTITPDCPIRPSHLTITAASPDRHTKLYHRILLGILTFAFASTFTYTSHCICIPTIVTLFFNMCCNLMVDVTRRHVKRSTVHCFVIQLHF